VNALKIIEHLSNGIDLLGSDHARPLRKPVVSHGKHAKPSCLVTFQETALCQAGLDQVERGPVRVGAILAKKRGDKVAYSVVGLQLFSQAENSIFQTSGGPVARGRARNCVKCALDQGLFGPFPPVSRAKWFARLGLQ
jgi:hypothetical protein